MSSGFVQWKMSNSGGSSEFLQLKSGGNYRVRPVLQPLSFQKCFNKIGTQTRSAVMSEEVAKQIKQKHPELGNPANRYAIYVLDRNDGNKVKIMEFTVSVYRQFCNRYQATGKDPSGGNTGGDWSIRVEGSKLTTKYYATFIEDSPLTNEEKDSIKKELNGDKEKLAKIFKYNSLEEAEKRLFGPDEEEEEEGEENVEEEKETGNKTDEDSSNDDFDPGW